MDNSFMTQGEVFSAGINILTFIPLLIPEGGMSPLPVRKDSGGKPLVCIMALGC